MTQSGHQIVAVADPLPLLLATLKLPYPPPSDRGGFPDAYMTDVGGDVAAAVLNAMSGTAKAQFFEFLIAKHETHEGLVEHLEHFQKMMHIVTDTAIFSSIPCHRYGTSVSSVTA
jgi:hypothetical protein